MIAVSIVLALVAAVLLAQTVSDVLSIGWALARRRPRALSGVRPQRLLVLIPAHDEELLIEACVRSLLALQYPPARLSVVVIADNCSDRTATLARAAGARCLERQDRRLPGKPRAIAWALDQVRLSDYDAVAIIDADTIVDRNFVTELDAVGPLRAKAVQGFFDLSNPNETPITRMSAVLATATHQFAYPLKGRAGLNVPLVGNGMVIGTDVLGRYGWQAFSICEDWEMFALLTERGVAIEPAPRARILSQEARSLDQSSTQRQRWTAGKLTVLARVGPRILRSRHIGARQKLDALAELAAPGPGLHLGLVVLLGLACVTLPLPGGMLLLGALGASLLRPAAFTMAALTVHPHPAQAVRAFAFLPIYAVWRIGAAVRALRILGDAPWVRTQRHQTGGA